jgi:hypothetical protein
MVPPFKLSFNETTYEMKRVLLWGLEVRKRLVGGGITGIALPDISLGAGYSSYTGGFALSRGYSVTTTDTYEGVTYQQGIDAQAKGETDWNIGAFNLEAVISKSLVVITPFAGIGVVKNCGEVKTAISTVGEISLTREEESMSKDLSIVGSGTEKTEDTQIYFLGGLELNLAFFKINLNGEICGDKYAVNLGTRFQFR